MEKEPIIHSVGKSSYTKDDNPRVIVDFSVYNINTIILKSGISITASNLYTANINLINKTVEIEDDGYMKIFNYIVHVQFKDKTEEEAFKLECNFSLSFGSILVDEYIADLEARDAMYEIFAHIGADPYYYYYINFKFS